MKILKYFKISETNDIELITEGEATLNIKLANIGIDNPSYVNGYLTRDTSGLHIFLYESSDVTEISEVPITIVFLDLIAAEAALDSFLSSKGFIKINEN